MGLAEVLADSRSKATASEVDKLVSKCPIVPILDDKEKTIFTRQDKPDLGVMVGTLNATLPVLYANLGLLQTQRSQQSVAALVKYAVNAKEDRQLELLPRLLSYVRHLPAYEWKEVVLGRGTYIQDVDKKGILITNNRTSTCRCYYIQPCGRLVGDWIQGA